jgi:hypothetical protein
MLKTPMQFEEGLFHEIVTESRKTDGKDEVDRKLAKPSVDQIDSGCEGLLPEKIELSAKSNGDLGPIRGQGKILMSRT